jgi:hypothetical protein
MVKSFIFVSSVFFVFQEISFAQEFESKDMCFNCHMIIEGKGHPQAEMYKGDVHFRKGISCASCHGGDATSDDQDVAMSKEKGFIGIPGDGQVAKICSKCHSNEFNLLVKSVHGQSESGKGMIINNCITCHGVHNITPVKSPSSKVNGKNIVMTCAGCHSNASYMKNYNPGLSVDQLEKYKTSMHGKKIFAGDTKVANCASCHGSHDIKKANDPQSKVYFSNIPLTCSKCHGNADYMKGYKIPTDQYEKYRTSVHGIPVLEKGDRNAPSCNGCHGSHGAAPPQVESIAKVCGICHALNAQMFAESPHKEAFEKKQIHECVACHSNHGIVHPTEEMIGDGERSVCKNCHGNNDKGIQLAVRMKQMMDSLVSEVDAANYFLNRAEQLGMDVSDAKFDANDIKKVLIVTRNNIHYSRLDKFEEAITEGFKLTSTGKTVGAEAIDEYYFRRAGFAVSTLFITILAISLYLKLRKIERVKT